MTHLNTMVRRHKDDRILVVDHDPDDCAIIEDELSRAGYVVEIATGAETVFDRLTARSYDAILTDAGSSSLAADRLQTAAYEHDPDIAILIIAEATELACAVSCLRDGAFDYITRPIDPQDLRRRVDHALDQRRRQVRSRHRSRNRDARAAEQSAKINQLKLLSIKVLNHTMEANDESTRNHSTRVSILVGAVARHMGVNDALSLETIALAGLLHDVGKIGVPEYILNKPSALEPSEFEHIKRHPELGEMILKPLLAAPVLAIVRHHHERYDGRGYPDGIAGEEIPLGARIVAVADSYDAMTCSRPYRDGMSHEKALSILSAGATSQWDSAVVDSLIAVAAQGAVETARAVEDVDLHQFEHLGLLFTGD